MDEDLVHEAAKEARRFLDYVKKLKVERATRRLQGMKDVPYQDRTAAAVRRASLDLSRALSAMRRRR